tara:strand:+ start:616 stop:2907 length:2292 start_codon:yes stop_codon:yes gene_type:complete
MSDFRKPRADNPILPTTAIFRKVRKTPKKPKGRRGKKPKGKKVGNFVSRQDPNYLLRKADDEARKAREDRQRQTEQQERQIQLQVEDIRDRRQDRAGQLQIAQDRFALEAGQARANVRNQREALRLQGEGLILQGEDRAVRIQNQANQREQLRLQAEGQADTQRFRVAELTQGANRDAARAAEAATLRTENFEIYGTLQRIFRQQERREGENLKLMKDFLTQQSRAVRLDPAVFRAGSASELEDAPFGERATSEQRRDRRGRRSRSKTPEQEAISDAFTGVIESRPSPTQSGGADQTSSSSEFEEVLPRGRSGGGGFEIPLQPRILRGDPDPPERFGQYATDQEAADALRRQRKQPPPSRSRPPSSSEESSAGELIDEAIDEARLDVVRGISLEELAEKETTDITSKQLRGAQKRGEALGRVEATETGQRVTQKARGRIAELEHSQVERRMAYLDGIKTQLTIGGIRANILDEEEVREKLYANQSSLSDTGTYTHSFKGDPATASLRDVIHDDRALTAWVALTKREEDLRQERKVLQREAATDLAAERARAGLAERRIFEIKRAEAEGRDGDAVARGWDREPTPQEVEYTRQSMEEGGELSEIEDEETPEQTRKRKERDARRRQKASGESQQRQRETAERIRQLQLRQERETEGLLRQQQLDKQARGEEAGEVVAPAARAVGGAVAGVGGGVVTGIGGLAQGVSQGVYSQLPSAQATGAFIGRQGYQGIVAAGGLLQGGVRGALRAAGVAQEEESSGSSDEPI